MYIERESVSGTIKINITYPSNILPNDTTVSLHSVNFLFTFYCYECGYAKGGSFFSGGRILCLVGQLLSSATAAEQQNKRKQYTVYQKNVLPPLLLLPQM